MATFSSIREWHNRSCVQHNAEEPIPMVLSAKNKKKKATIVLHYSISFKLAVVHMLIITGIGSP